MAEIVTSFESELGELPYLIMKPSTPSLGTSQVISIPCLGASGATWASMRALSCTACCSLFGEPDSKREHPDRERVIAQSEITGSGMQSRAIEVKIFLMVRPGTRWPGRMLGEASQKIRFHARHELRYSFWA